MAIEITLQQIEQQVTELPTHDQLKLVAFITQHLLESTLVASTENSVQEQAIHTMTASLDDWLAECEQVAELWEGEFDSAEDLHHMRHEGK